MGSRLTTVQILCGRICCISNTSREDYLAPFFSLPLYIAPSHTHTLPRIQQNFRLLLCLVVYVCIQPQVPSIKTAVVAGTACRMFSHKEVYVTQWLVSFFGFFSHFVRGYLYHRDNKRRRTFMPFVYCVLANRALIHLTASQSVICALSEVKYCPSQSP